MRIDLDRVDWLAVGRMALVGIPAAVILANLVRLAWWVLT